MPDGLREWRHRELFGRSGPQHSTWVVAQQDTPVLGHASRSTLLSAVCRSAGHVLVTNAALSIERSDVVMLLSSTN